MAPKRYMCENSTRIVCAIRRNTLFPLLGPSIKAFGVFVTAFKVTIGICVGKPGTTAACVRSD